MFSCLLSENFIHKFLFELVCFGDSRVSDCFIEELVPVEVTLCKKINASHLEQVRLVPVDARSRVDIKTKRTSSVTSLLGVPAEGDEAELKSNEIGNVTF